MKAGMYKMSAAEYHADPAPRPSLSASLIKMLVNRSPLHAWAAHPRLGGHLQVESEIFDLGTISHEIILEGTANIVEIDAPDWRTKAAKEARDAARAVGKVPVLAGKMREILEMVERVDDQVCQFSPVPFKHGIPEQTMVWQDDYGIWCRARPDWIHEGVPLIDDFKTTSTSAEPHSWARTAMGQGAEIQAALYLRGLKKLANVRKAEFRFIVAENYPPYAVSAVRLSPADLQLADRKIDYALKLWADCLERKVWPGYGEEMVEYPAWAETAWMSREERTDAAD